MSAWAVEGGALIPKQEAVGKIQEKARAQGFAAGATIKVFYDGRQVVTPADLPDQVDMNKIEISSVLNNAAKKSAKKGKKKGC
jgi:hypothetical protein